MRSEVSREGFKFYEILVVNKTTKIKIVNHTYCRSLEEAFTLTRLTWQDKAWSMYPYRRPYV